MKGSPETSDSTSSAAGGGTGGGDTTAAARGLRRLPPVRGAPLSDGTAAARAGVVRGARLGPTATPGARGSCGAAAGAAGGAPRSAAGARSIAANPCAAPSREKRKDGLAFGVLPLAELESAADALGANAVQLRSSCIITVSEKAQACTRSLQASRRSATSAAAALRRTRACAAARRRAMPRVQCQASVVLHCGLVGEKRICPGTQNAAGMSAQPRAAPRPRRNAPAMTASDGVSARQASWWRT